MPRPARLRAADVRAVFLLAGECRDLGDDPLAWRRHLAAGAARLADADLALAGELAGLRADRPRDLGGVPWGFDHGFDVAGWRIALDHLAADPNYSVLLNRYAERVRAGGGGALARTDLIPDREWAGSTEYQLVYRTLGVDHGIQCFAPVPGAADEFAGSLLSRAVGRPDFTPRQKAVVAELYAVIGPLVGGPLARFGEPSPADLPPQCRRVLRCLLEGDGDKQIAARLGLSWYTVNEYTKRIYKHFGCQGRAELLARWVRRGWGVGGRWADPDPPPGR